MTRKNLRVILRVNVTRNDAQMYADSKNGVIPRNG